MRAKQYVKRVLAMASAAVLTITSMSMFTPAVAEQVDAEPQYPFMDTTLSFEERAADLVSRLTLDEKVNQLGRNTVAVPRLGLAKYDYWNEALHGIQNGSGEGTSFPMPLSLAVTWDEDFIAEVASAIADECRGHNQPASEGGRGRGLTYWCPTVNLDRHPLWGRTNEAYGEDAFVSGMLATAFVDGMQGDDDTYYKTIATIKHYALNNHENQRGSTSSDASEADIRDYYTRVYRYIIEKTATTKELGSLMSAYNAVNYTPSSGNTFLLTTLLRQTFGFTGFVTSDCGAIDNLEKSQKWVPTKNTLQKDNYTLKAGKELKDYVDADGVVTKPGSVALALMAGCDMDCNGDVYPVQAKKAYEAGILDMGQIDKNVYNNLLARFKLGEFDPDEMVNYRSDAYSFANVVENEEHRALADEAATKSVVLLKNDNNTLPLKASDLTKVVLVGDNVDVCWLGNYSGKPQKKNQISMYDGINDYLFTHNKNVQLSKVTTFDAEGAIKEADKALIEEADVVIVLGSDIHDDSSEGHDREELKLTRNQNEVIKNTAALNANTIVYLQTSNMVEIKEFKNDVKAILWASQNGQGQGVGMANQLFGETNPSGKLPFTWYKDEAQLPGIRQYGMTEAYLQDEKAYPNGGFTYQYFNGDVEYPFGYGLSYTTYAYSNVTVDKTAVDANGNLTVTVDVKNTGSMAGSEVVQVYVKYPDGANRAEKKQIKGFAKLDLQPGETKKATVTLDMSDCRFWDDTAKKNVVPTGEYTIEVGASSSDIKGSKKVTVSGKLAESVNVVTATPSGVAVEAGKTMTTDVTVSLKDDSFVSDKATITYTSKNPAVAKVDANGVVTGVAAGVTTIEVTATYNGTSKTVSYPVAVTPTAKATELTVNGKSVDKFDAATTTYNVAVKDGKVPNVSAKAGSGVTVDVKQATAVPGKATVTLTKGTEKTVYIVNFVDACDITAIEFPSVKLTTAQAANYKLSAKATTTNCGQAAHNGNVTYTYAVLEDGIKTLNATITGDTLKATGEGRITVQVTATYNGAKKVSTAQILVSDAVDRNQLEELIRVKVAGDDFDPTTLENYYAEIEKARTVYFNENATQSQVDEACASLAAVKAKLIDRRYVVANFPEANNTYSFNDGRNIYVDWKKIRDDENKEVTVDFTTHKVEKLELRFKATITPTNRNIKFTDAVNNGAWIKLRSNDESNRNSDPDLSQFGGNGQGLESNNEHNFGWAVTDYITDWGTTEVSIPLATTNPKDNSFGLPVVDIINGVASKNYGENYTSRGSIDWTKMDRFFMIIPTKADVLNGASFTVKLEDVRVVDKTLEEEREKLSAELGMKVDLDACQDADKVAAYNAAKATAEEVIKGTNCMAIINANEALVAARNALGVTVSVDKATLEEALKNTLTDAQLERYTISSVEKYKVLIQTAKDVMAKQNATQLEVNRAVAGLTNADSVLQLIKVNAYVLDTLLASKSLEQHTLEVQADTNLDLTDEKDYTVTVRFDIKLESTHPNPTTDNKWLPWVRNGKLRVWSVDTPNNDNGVEIAKLNCEKDSVMTSYTKPGEWMTVNVELPASFIEQGKLTRVGILMYNDTQGYAMTATDGNDWNNDTGVKMTVRNIQILSDRPRDDIPVSKTLLNTAIEEAEAVNTSRYTPDSVTRLTTALNAAKTVSNNENATQEQVDAAAKALNDAIEGLKPLRTGDPVDVSVIFSGSNGTQTTLLDGTQFYTDWKVGDGLSDSNTPLGGADLAGTAANGANKNLVLKANVAFDVLNGQTIDFNTAWKQIGFRLRSSKIGNANKEAQFYYIQPKDVTVVDGVFKVEIPLEKIITENIDWTDVKELNIRCEVATEYEIDKANNQGKRPEATAFTMTLSDVKIVAKDGVVVDVNKTALNAAIAAAKAKTEADYTTESWAAMTAKLTAAEAIAAKADATQAEVDTAANELNAAVAALVAKPTPTIVYGDLTHDGEVKVEDALKALQAATSKITLTAEEEMAADVDNVKGVSAADALMILQHATGKISQFPVEK